jgi:hypothetical protein
VAGVRVELVGGPADGRRIETGEGPPPHQLCCADRPPLPEWQDGRFDPASPEMVPGVTHYYRCTRRLSRDGARLYEYTGWH